MARHGKYFVVATVVALSFGLSCSSEEDGSGDSSGSGNPGTSGNPPSNPSEVPQSQSDEIRDIDGDGELDPLTAGDFGAAGVPVTEADIEAQRNSACTGWVVEPEPLGATLFMVLDASSSMNQPANGTGERSKWEVTRDALIDAVNQLSDDTALGMVAYPNKVIDGTAGDPSMCVNIDALVSLGVLGANNHRQTVIDALNAVETNTCTPTHDAYLVGLQDFAATPAPGQKYIMLMTDGQPTLFQNCEPGTCEGTEDPIGSESFVVEEIQRAYNELGIKTFMLGCPGSEEHVFTGLDNRGWLSQAAELGGTSPGNCVHEPPGPFCHFDMTQAADFGAALRAALASIVGQVVACDYGIPVPPEGLTIDLNAINLYLYPDGNDPIQILRTEGPDCEQGWYYDEVAALIKLCPTTCALAQSDPNAKAELMFGCESDVILPE
jgi:hypothetical protein